MNKNLLWIVFLLIPIAEAIEEVDIDYRFKYGEDIDIRRECFNDGAICDATFYCNISVYDKDNIVVIDSGAMDKTGEYYNYTIPINLTTNATTDTGIYRSRVTCSDGTDSGSEVFYFRISPTDGNNNVFLVLGILSFILLILGLSIKNHYIGATSGLLFMVTGVYTMIYGFYDVADLYTRGVASLFLGIGLFFFISGVLGAIDEEDIGIQ